MYSKFTQTRVTRTAERSAGHAYRTHAGAKVVEQCVERI